MTTSRFYRKINVQSISFDNCVFNREFLASDSPERLIEENPALFKHLLESANWFDETIFMVGSYRQSVFDDMVTNAQGNAGSCYPALLDIREYVAAHVKHKQISVDPYLLSDTYGNRLPGANFYASVHDKQGYAFDEWLFDTSKLTILYAQMHKVARLHPRNEITFDFFDEGSYSDTLTKLRVFFSNNPDLIPANVTLRLHNYTCRHIDLIEEIQGTGGVDYNYHKNVKLMTNLVGMQYGYHRFHINIMDMLLQKNRLSQFKRQRCLVGKLIDAQAHSARFKKIREELSDEENPDGSVSEVIEDAPGFNPDSYLHDLRHKIGVLEKNPPPEFRYQTAQFVSALKELHKVLVKDVERQVSRNSPPSKIYASEAMHIANKTTVLIDDLRSNISPKTKIEKVDGYYESCKKPAKKGRLMKVLIMAACAAVGFIVGGAIGLGIGVAAGAVGGPAGSAAGGLAGMIAGASKGAVAGISVGASLTGLGAAAVSGFCLFKPSQPLRHAKAVSESAMKIYSKLQAYPDEHGMMYSPVRTV